MKSQRNEKKQTKSQKPKCVRMIGVTVVVAMIFIVNICLPFFLTSAVSASDLKKDKIEIDSAESFVKELIKNDAMGAVFGKKQYTLKEDIELSQSQIDELCSSNVSFWGELNGNGHKVMPLNRDLVLKTPLIDYVHSDAQINFIEFSNWTISVADGQAAAIVGTNEGMWQNVKFDNITLNIEQLYSGKKNPNTAIAAMAINNVGKIKNCVADIDIKLHSENISEPDFTCVVGGLIAKNFVDGRIEDVILDVEYPSDIAALDTNKNLRRNDIGLIIGYGDTDLLKNITVISNKLGIGKNAHDIYELQVRADNSLYVVELAELVQKFGVDSPWRNTDWNSDGTWWSADKSTASLPTLRPINSEQ